MLLYIAGEIAFTKSYWGNYFAKAFNVYLSDEPSQCSGSRSWPLSEEKTIADPRCEMIRAVVNNERHLFVFCCCMFFTIMSYEETNAASMEGNIGDIGEVRPTFVPNFFNGLLEHHDDATVYAFALELHKILLLLVKRGHQLRTFACIMELEKVSIKIEKT